MSMRKILSILLAAILTVLCCSCSAGKAENTGGLVIHEEPAETANSVEVEEKLLTVEITLPQVYVGEETTQEDLDRSAAEGNYLSAVLNKDGSATFTMTKQQHEKLVAALAESIDKGLKELVDSEEYPSFTKVEANEGYTEFTVTTTLSELGLNESLSVLVFYMYGGMYNTFLGTPADDIAVTFINAETGEVIDTAHSANMNADALTE